MMSKLIYLSFLVVLLISVSAAPSKTISNLQDDFNTEQIPSNQNGAWNFFRNFVANILSSLSNLLNNSSQRETEGDQATPRPIVSMLNTVVEALRSGSVQRLLDSIMDQFNQLVGNIGQMYKDGVEREIYVIERNPKINTRERLVLNKLVDKMRLTQSNIEELAKQENETETSKVEDKIDTIKVNLNEIWTNLKNTYSNYNIKSTNVSYVLDRLDFLDPKQIRSTAGELQNELNKLWRDLSRNLMQKIDGIDSSFKRLTKQTIKQANNNFNDEIDLIETGLNVTHESTINKNDNQKSNLELQVEYLVPESTNRSTKFDLLNKSKKLENLNRLSNLIKGRIDNQLANLIFQTTQGENDTSNQEQDNRHLNRYLRSVDRLQLESEKLLDNHLKNLISTKSKKLAKLQNTNETNDEDDANSNDSNGNESKNNETNDSKDSNSSDSDENIPELGFENESQLKKFTNMLRTQFNQSISQFTNYWQNIGKKINDRRKNFNATASGRKFNFDPFGFRFGNKPNSDEDSFYEDEHHLNDYSDYSSSLYSHHC